MTDFKSNINRGILNGVKVDEKTVETVGELAEKLEELDNGVMDPEEETIAALMGAEAKPKDVASVEDIVPEGSGEKIAEHGVLTGAVVDEEKAEELAEVADTLESISEYEKAVNDGELKRQDSEINEMGETLAVVMGVESAKKTPDSK